MNNTQRLTKILAVLLASSLVASPLFAIEAGEAPELTPQAQAPLTPNMGALNVPGIPNSLQAPSGISVPGSAPELSLPAAASVSPEAASASAAVPAANASASVVPASAGNDGPSEAAISQPAAGRDVIASPATPSQAAIAAGTRRAASSRKATKAARAQLAAMAQAPVSGQFDGAGAPGSAAPFIGKLGRKASTPDSRTLQLSKYIKPRAVDNTPDTADFSKPVKNWGMMLNDNIGDCTVAACGHQIQQWTANAGTQKTPSDASILKAYEAVSGYVPNDPSTDRGADMLNVLKYWRKTGISGDKIGAFASVSPSNFDHIKTAVWTFGSAYLGLAMPVSAQKQDVWDVPAGGATGDGAPGSWGGHAVEIAGYGPQGVLIVTWGALKWMTWDFLKTYGDEAYAIISKDFLQNGKTPNNGLDLAALKADLAQVTDSSASKHSPTRPVKRPPLPKKPTKNGKNKKKRSA